MRSWQMVFPLFLIGLLLAGCTPATPVLVASPSPLPPPTQIPSPVPSATPSTIPSATPNPPTPSPSPTAALSLCSPLAGTALEALPALVSNPFHPPAPGSDNPHQGVDLAILDPASRIALTGSAVQAILPGEVAQLIKDRFPYGNAVMIEIPLEAAAPEWWARAGLPAPAPTLAPKSALTCPAFSQPPVFDPQRRSVYMLYAHLQSIEALSVGQAVSCGQPLGTVGMSGNALNPHLHVEVRAAPAGMRLGSMAHYDASASQDEMAAYCLWRISGLFQLADPFKLMGLNE